MSNSNRHNVQRGDPAHADSWTRRHLSDYRQNKIIGNRCMLDWSLFTTNYRQIPAKNNTENPLWQNELVINCPYFSTWKLSAGCFRPNTNNAISYRFWKLFINLLEKLVFYGMVFLLKCTFLIYMTPHFQLITKNAV